MSRELPIYTLPELYDQQYLGYRDDIPHYLRLAHDTGGPILELGAGTGRLTLELAREGHRVVAVDSEEAMLQRAGERLAAAGLGESVSLTRGDMRTLDLTERFPLVVAAFNTLMHLYSLDDQDAALAAVARHLQSGGSFAFDLYSPQLGAQGVMRREAEWGQVGGEEAELFLVQEHDPHRQLVTSRYYLDSTREDGALTRTRAVLRQRYYTRFEIERALRHAGLDRLRLSGDFAGGPYTDASRHLVGIARR